MCSENDLGSSFTRSGGFSTSFAFPLSFLLGLPTGAGMRAAGGGSRRLSEEFDRESDCSLSALRVPESDSS